MEGTLLVDKPTGISSFGVVAKVRWIIKEAISQHIKIGHTGTLDPAASGLMILVLGKYTKRAGEFSKLDKTYETEVTLGKTSTTGDCEGEIVQINDARPGFEQVQEVLRTFIGEIEQTPPSFSAIKVGGQRAYKLARMGKEVVLQPRKATIHSIENVQYVYPKLSFATSVSSGTYIRSLAEDIGAKLGTGAYMSGLRRTKVGQHDIKDALSLEELSFGAIQQQLKP
jgi:tRNA pseudouridine55 synthase